MVATIVDVTKRLGLRGLIKRGGETYRTKEIKDLDEEISALNKKYYLLDKSEFSSTPSITHDIEAILQRQGPRLWPSISPPDRRSQCMWLYQARDVPEYPDDLFFTKHHKRILPHFMTLLLAKLERYHVNHNRCRLPPESKMTESADAERSLIVRLSLSNSKDKLRTLTDSGAEDRSTFSGPFTTIDGDRSPPRKRKSSSSGSSGVESPVHPSADTIVNASERPSKRPRQSNSPRNGQQNRGKPISDAQRQSNGIISGVNDRVFQHPRFPELPEFSPDSAIYNLSSKRRKASRVNQQEDRSMNSIQTRRDSFPVQDGACASPKTGQAPLDAISFQRNQRLDYDTDNDDEDDDERSVDELGMRNYPSRSGETPDSGDDGPLFGRAVLREHSSSAGTSRAGSQPSLITKRTSHDTVSSHLGARNLSSGGKPPTPRDGGRSLSTRSSRDGRRVGRPHFSGPTLDQDLTMQLSDNVRANTGNTVPEKPMSIVPVPSEFMSVGEAQMAAVSHARKHLVRRTHWTMSAATPHYNSPYPATSLHDRPPVTRPSLSTVNTNEHNPATAFLPASSEAQKSNASAERVVQADPPSPDQTTSQEHGPSIQNASVHPGSIPHPPKSVVHTDTAALSSGHQETQPVSFIVYATVDSPDFYACRPLELRYDYCLQQLRESIISTFDACTEDCPPKQIEFQINEAGRKMTWAVDFDNRGPIAWRRFLQVLHGKAPLPDIDARAKM